MKKISKIFSIFTIASVFALGAMTACTASEKLASDKTSGETTQNDSAANDKTTTESKSVENKVVETEKAKLIEVYDGREGPNGKEKEFEATKADTDFVQKEVRPQGEVIKKLVGQENQADGSPCYEDPYRVEGVAEGAFTKADSKQKAYLYTLCQGDGGRETFYIGGILIAENGKTIANYVYGELLGYAEIKSLPDINQNGLSEIVLTPRSVVNEGYYTSAIEIVEISANKIVGLGATQTFSNSPDTGETGGQGEKSGSSTGYIISVQTGKTPAFFRETYHRKSDDDSWVLKKKSEKFAPTKIDNSEYSKVFKLLTQ